MNQLDGVYDMEDESLVASTATLSLEPCTLMSLPAEVRLNIYRFMFICKGDVPLVIDGRGHIAFMTSLKLPLQFLQVSKTIYFEACPVLYGANNFLMRFDDLSNLAKFHQASRMCIERLKVESSGSDFLLNGNIGELALGVIGQGLPYLQKLELIMAQPSALLQTTLKLSNCLPCSPLRKWPILKIMVEIPQLPSTNIDAAIDVAITNNDEAAVAALSMAKDADTLVKRHTEKLDKRFTLESLGSSTHLKLGHEMPEFDVIRLKGFLSSRLCRLLDDHVSTFGDCAFEKEVTRKADTKAGILEEHTYTWRRRGDDVVDTTMNKKEASSDMHRWVPKLSKELYAQLLASGYSVKDYKTNDHFARAAKKIRHEQDEFPEV